jgi:hypothetical protein
VLTSIDPSFGHWLAGFTDGEGAFVLARVTSTHGNPHGKTWATARYEITLRADDAATLDLIRDTLGIGTVRATSAASASRPNQKPALRYAVWRLGECLVLVDFFERFPLRAKKRHQFDIWARGVRELAKGSFRDEAVILACRAELAAVRVYDEAVLQGWAPTALRPLVRETDRGEAPNCLCGCGQAVLPHGGRGIPHPDNLLFARFLRGHHARTEASRARVRLRFRGY